MYTYIFFFHKITLVTPLTLQFALVKRWPYCPGRPKKLCFTSPSPTPMVSTTSLGMVKQSFSGLPGQYGRHVTRANTQFTVQAYIRTFLKVGSAAHFPNHFERE